MFRFEPVQSGFNANHLAAVGIRCVTWVAKYKSIECFAALGTTVKIFATEYLLALISDKDSCVTEGFRYYISPSPR